MNKTELLDELAAKFHKLGKVAPVELSVKDIAIRKEEDVTWYLAGVYEAADNRLIRKNISFYVEADGKAEEAAFYAEKLPVDSLIIPAKKTFRNLVVMEIEKKVAAEIFLKGTVDSVDEESEFAIITAYQIETDEVINKKYFVYRDTKDVVQFKVMKEII